MLRNLLILSFCIFFNSLKVNGQTYPLPQPGAVWSDFLQILIPVSLYGSSTYYVGDTLMCGYTYARYCDCNAGDTLSCGSNNLYSRYDNGKVYFKSVDTCGGPETLYFDFSLLQGDTFQPLGAIVDTTYLITLQNGQLRKYLHLSDTTGSYVFEWIDGIGDKTFGLFSGIPVCIDCNFGMICHRDSTGLVLQNSGPYVCEDLVCLGVPLSVTLSSTTLCGAYNLSYNGSQDGSINLTAFDGLPPYSYLWSPGGSTDADPQNLAAGTYYVTVTDGNNNTIFDSIVLSEGVISLTLDTTAISSCLACDGLASASASGGDPPYTYSWDTSPIQTVDTISALCAGQYAVVIIDSLGESGCATIEVLEPQPNVLSLSVTAWGAGCSFTGSAYVVTSGGSSLYTYLWDNGETTSSINGLSPGIYCVTVSDSGGCSNYGCATVIYYPGPSIDSLLVKPGGCNLCQDTLVATLGSGGSAPYTYMWLDSSPSIIGVTSTVTGICAGLYYFEVTDANGCTDNQSIQVTDSVSFNVSMSHNNVSCYGYCNGFAQSSVTGGIPPYTYLWSDSQSGPQAVNLCAGTYCVTITGSNGCSDSACVTITQPLSMIITTNQNNVSCYNACDADASVSVSGGSPPYSYLWDDVSFQTTQIATNLCNGTYNVTITDSLGCISTSSVVIVQPQIINPLTTVFSSTCGLNNGVACVTVVGGVAPYVIQWDDPATTVGQCINNAFCGVYNPIVSDANGCFFTTPVIINCISEPTIDSINTTDVWCAGNCVGTSTVYISGYTPPYTYEWKDNTGSTINTITDTGMTQTISGLCGGTYSIYVADSNGCITANLFTINEPLQIVSAIISSSNVSCNGGCDGSASVAVGNGTPPYSYLWTNGDTSANVTSLCSGAHNVFITDANGCTSSEVVTISEPVAVSISAVVSNISCYGMCDGSISLNITGGTPFYMYSWFPNVASGPIATGLCAGTYSVTVTDLNNCSDNGTYTITEPPALSLTFNTIPSTCGFNNGSACATVVGGTSPFVIQWDDPANPVGTCAYNLFCGVYNPIISDGNGCVYTAPVIVNCIGGPTIDSMVTTDEICAGDCNGTATVYATATTPPLTYVWQNNTGDTIGSNGATIFSLCPGTYTVAVSDANGCVQADTVTVNGPTTLSTAVIGATDVTCDGDTITLLASVSGGLLPYSYLWGVGGGTDSVFTATITQDTAFGLIITDGNQCTNYSDISIASPSSLTLSSSGGGSICAGDSATITAVISGGSPPFSYAWSNGGTSSSISVSPDSTLIYTVTITDTCSLEDSTSIIVVVETCLSISEPNEPPGLMSIYPNPNSGEFSISFELKYAQFVRIELIDLTGQMIHAYNEEFPRGNQEHKVKIQNQAVGIYTLRIVLESGVITRKLIVSDL